MGDDGADPVRSQALVRRMVEQDKVLAIFGEYSVTLNSVMPYLEQKGVPLIGASGSDPSADHYTVAFNPVTSADIAEWQGAVLSITTQSHAKKLSLIYCREVIGCKNGADRIKQSLPYGGLKLVHEAQVSLGQPDFTAEVLAAQQAGADVVVTIVDAASAIRYARSAHRQNYKPILASVHNLNMDTLLAGGADVEGTLTVSRSPVWQTSPMAKRYRDTVDRYQPNTPRGQLGADVFVFGAMLEKIAPALQEPPTVAQLTEALYALKNETLGGLVPGVTFPRGNDRTKVNVCSVPTRVENGKFVSFDGKDTFVCWKS
jgi:branched-chain amino acid transport system substrate-binding protein